MAVDLIDYVESLKREIQPPGADLFVGVTDEQWVGYLADAFWEARLDGFLTGYIVNADGDAIEDSGGTPFPRQLAALIILYAGIRVLRNRILNTQTMFRAKAGPVEFEQQNSATMLAEMLRQLQGTKDRIIDALEDADMTGVLVLDAYSTRMFSSPSYFGTPELSGG